MKDKLEIRTTYCTHCTKDVQVAVSPGTPRNGQANLQESDEVICLDFGDACDGAICPLSQIRPIVMGVRLARSGLREEWTTVRAQCEGCGQINELKILDREHAFCPLCGTTNTWMVLKFDDDGKVAVTGRK
ncbi:MAG: hypothetical protein HKO65_13800 [Gemmatimonadetes bacterium]|nr:hypothetical protein [Gemmatimonadota bacterium]NNM06158.1 hypothetical protein [Gemmatimonadota bacterium]